MIKLSSVLILSFLLVWCSHEKPANPHVDLEYIFHNPPETARPWVYWYWMHGNASREGIKKDLHDMAEAGIGGAYLMPVGALQKPPETDPPAYPLTEIWWDMVTYAVEEADRLGLKIAMNACEGWAVAGGPWITPELSMQVLVWENTVIEGGIPFSGKVNKPSGHRQYKDYCPDIAVLAYPAPEGWGITSTDLNPVATSNIEEIVPQKVVQGGTPQVLTDGWIQYEFDEPFTCRSVIASPSPAQAYQLHRMEIQVSDDGTNFRSLGRLSMPWHGWQDGGVGGTHSIENVTARFFRFIFDRSDMPSPTVNMQGSIGARNNKNFRVDHIVLSSAASINIWDGKAGNRWRRSPWTADSHVPAGSSVPLNEIIDLTDMVDDEGILEWTPPSDGKWIVQYFGYTTTGHENAPGGRGPASLPTGRGLECDKFNPVAAKIQFDGWFGAAMERIKPELRGTTLVMNHTDSWEAGSQNWSPVFRKEFTERRGYDPVMYLPAMTGVPIESADISERFLFDIRRTISDLICDAFFKTTVDLTHEAGALFSAECTAPTTMSDGLQIYRDVDFPMGEFWIRTSRNLSKRADIQDAVSGGHIYGKPVIQAEAFTLKGMHWNEDPYFLKPSGDFTFAQGINRFVLHVWAHQAFPGNKPPGVTLTDIGTFFSGTQTWHKPGKAWFEYIERCQAMLQTGLPVVDVCYFIGEELPARASLREELNPGLPDGYSYDCINRDALLTRAKAKDGKLVMLDGLSYHLLVLPDSKRMTPEVATKIGELAMAGVPVIGPTPERSYSLSDFHVGKENLSLIVADSWRNVTNDITPEKMLGKLNIPTDIEFMGVDMTPVHRGELEYKSPPFGWNHRRTDDTDFYFVSNQEQKKVHVNVKFRVTGKHPELWHPVTGKIRKLTDWKIENGRTSIPLIFEPSESYFIVFRHDSNEKDGQIKNAVPNFPGFREYEELKGPWEVSFQANRGAPAKINLSDLISLTDYEDFGVKHFSGTAVYRNSFDWKPEHEARSSIWLDLGNVSNLAEVILNGNNLGVLWTPPFIVNVTGEILEGANELEIKVTNTWRNRFIGDSKVQEHERVTWTLFDNIIVGMNDDLDQAGLIGPVKFVISEAP